MNLSNKVSLVTGGNRGIGKFISLSLAEEGSSVAVHYNQDKEGAESVVKEIGPHAKPDNIQFAPALPKTRSGKIMRRILRKIAEGDHDDMGDISTLADPTVVANLISGSVQV